MKKDKEWLKNEVEVMGSETSENYPHEQMVDREEVLNLIDQLEEPVKVVIPRFVADHIAISKEGADSPRASMDVAYISKKINAWIAETADYMYYPNQEKFMRAWLDGYEVAKEKVYTVEIGTTILGSFFGDVDWYDYDCLAGDPDIESTLTESQIKSFDAKFWPFAAEKRR